MTDGRIPGKWISEPRFAEMNVDTWCVLTKAITWSNEAGTDGLIKSRYLSQFHPDGICHVAYLELVTLGIWVLVPEGYQFTEWSRKPHHGGLGQSTADEVRNRKERSRKTSQAYREKHKPMPVTEPVTSGGDVSRRTGKDRTGSMGDGVLETPNTTLSWATATPGNPTEYSADRLAS